jgi:hypothetical protein
MATVSFANDISPLFTQQDVSCMARFGVNLTDYAYMSQPANAQNVLNRLNGTTKPQMPMGGPYWSSANITLFEEWMQGGYQS